MRLVLVGVGVWVIIAEYLLEDGGGGHRAGLLCSY